MDLIKKGERGMEYNEIYDRTRELIVDYLKVDAEEITPQTNLVEDLCIDSIALVELGFKFSETFSVPMIEAQPEIFIMQNLVDFIRNEMRNQQYSKG